MKVPVRICDFDKESDRHQVKSVLLMRVTEPLHHSQQIVLLSNQMMVLEMINHLLPYLVLSSHLNLTQSTTLEVIPLVRVYMAESAKLDAG